MWKRSGVCGEQVMEFYKNLQNAIFNSFLGE